MKDNVSYLCRKLINWRQGKEKTIQQYVQQKVISLLDLQSQCLVNSWAGGEFTLGLYQPTLCPNPTQFVSLLQHFVNTDHEHSIFGGQREFSLPYFIS